MKYDIYKDGEFVNAIEASEEFVSGYCEKNGYTYEEVAEPVVEVEPTTKEVLNALLGVTE